MSSRVVGRGEAQKQYTASGSVMFFKALAEQDDGDLSLMERPCLQRAVGRHRTGTGTAQRSTSCSTGSCQWSSKARN
jgi:hypothetical protein